MERFLSIFSQLLKLFPRTEFQALVKAHRAERHARGFTCWGQFVAMLFCQLGRAHSLREICGGLASCEGKLSHLGITAPARATPAYADAHRPGSTGGLRGTVGALRGGRARPPAVPFQE